MEIENMRSINYLSTKKWKAFWSQSSVCSLLGPLLQKNASYLKRLSSSEDCMEVIMEAIMAAMQIMVGTMETITMPKDAMDIDLYQICFINILSQLKLFSHLNFSTLKPFIFIFRSPAQYFIISNNKFSCKQLCKDNQRLGAESTIAPKE